MSTDLNEFAGLKVLTVELASDATGVPFVTLERAVQRGGPDRWAVRRSGHVLGRDGDFTYEPLPSSRVERFYKRYRFATVAEAIKVWREHLRNFGADYSCYRIAAL
jgi:hypothetical protein